MQSKALATGLCGSAPSRKLAQSSRRVGAPLAKCDSVRCRGSVDSVAADREVHGYTTDQNPPFPILGRIEDAVLRGAENLAAPELRQVRRPGTSVDPMYLFACGMLWHQQGDATAGWELIHYLRSQDRDARAVAAELLART